MATPLARMSTLAYERIVGGQMTATLIAGLMITVVENITSGLSTIGLRCESTIERHMSELMAF